VHMCVCVCMCERQPTCVFEEIFFFTTIIECVDKKRKETV